MHTDFIKCPCGSRIRKQSPFNHKSSIKHMKYENERLKEKVITKYINEFYDDEFILSMIDDKMFYVDNQKLLCNDCNTLHTFRGIIAGDSNYIMKHCEECNKEIGKVRDDIYDGDLLQTEK